MLALITLHDAKEINFEKNGYGVLDDLVFNDGGSWEMNGEFKITFEVPALTEFTKYVEARNIVQAPVPFMDRQLFRIYRTEKTLSSIYVEARHIFYDLLDNWIEDTNIVSRTGNSAIQQLLSKTQYPQEFIATSNISATGSARIVRMNPVEALLDDQKENSFVNRWGGELVRNNFQIELLERMGADRGVKIEHRKDLLGYEATIDISTIVTRIHPVGFDGLELPEKYVDSPLMDSDHPIIAEVKYENIKAAVGDSADDEEAVPLEQAYELLRQAASNEFEVNHVDEPETVVNVDFVALHNTEQYKDFADLQEVRAGDTVKVSAYDHGFEITSRLVGFEFSLLKKDHYTSTTLGNHVLEYTSSETDVNDLRERVEEVERTAVTAILAANGRNRNYFGAEDPNTLELDARLGDNYFLENGESYITYLLVEVNGERYWKRASLDEVAFKNEMEENTRIVNEATETAGQALTAGNQAKELANQAKTAAENASEVGGQALTAGQQAQELANEAKAESSSALLKANEAIGSANILTTRVNTLNSQYDGLQTVVEGKASKTQVTQLSTQIDLRVEKDNIINQINVSTEGILIAGSKTHITGQTTIDTGVIETAHIANATINNAKIADLAVNEAKIASLAITNAKIGTAAVNEAKIADLAVTNAKIANGAISSAKIGEAAIQTAHIGDAQITTAKISSLSASKITTGTLNASDVNIINLNVSKLVGDRTNFVVSAWNEGASSLKLTASGIESIGATDNEVIKLGDGKVEFFNSSNQLTGYLSPTYSSSNRGFGIFIPEGRLFAIVNDRASAPNQDYLTIRDNEFIVNSYGTRAMQFGQDMVNVWRNLDINNYDINDVNQVHANRFHVRGRYGFLLDGSSGTTTLLDDNEVTLGVGTLSGWTNKIRVNTNETHVLSSGEIYIGSYGSSNTIQVGQEVINIRKSVSLNRMNMNDINVLRFKDSNASIFTDSTNGYFVMRADGEVTINTYGYRKIQAGKEVINMWRDINMRGHDVTNTSDSRLKENIQNYKSDSLSTVRSWNIVSFNYKEGKGPAGRQVGLIAQDTPALSLYSEEDDLYLISQSKQVMLTTHAVQQLATIQEIENRRNKTEHNVLMNKITHLESYVKNKIEIKLEKAEKEIESLKEKIKLMEESA